MKRISNLFKATLIGMGLLAALPQLAHGQPYRCSYSNAAASTSGIEFDFERSIYAYVGTEQDDAEGSPKYEIKFKKSGGALAAAIKYVGFYQGGKIQTGDSHVLTFHMKADGNFVEVNQEGQILKGLCKKVPKLSNQ